ncbi:hypothetical protein LDENG_00121440 [Lucifuga dentata]|nr:hypothetical protein LDENG_00121440 [Lucifuga dentata]
MAAAYEGFLLCFLLFFTLTDGKETTVTCVNSEKCMLPCKFQSDGKGARVMWYKRKAVVSCMRYGNTSFVVGHNSPADRYKDRTDLYADQVLGGNATLLLRNVTPQDQGKYFCITMTAPRTDESGIISLIVKAPVAEVDIELSGDTVTCMARRIYPAPKLTWSTDPPVDAEMLQNRTNIQKDPQGFYNIQSSLLLKGNDTNHTYVCLVSNDVNSRKAILRPEVSIQASLGGDVQIRCSSPDSSLKNFNLTWKFRGLDPILSINVTESWSEVKVWDQWKSHVSNGLSAASILQLHGLKQEHQGTYTCEVSTPTQTYVTQTDVILTGDFSVYIYISIIVGLVYLLMLAYGMLVFLGLKMRGMQRDTRQAERRGESSEAVSTEEVKRNIPEQ